MKAISRRPAAVALALAVFLGGPVFSADVKKTRDEQVVDDRAELQDNDTWIYNDLTKASEAAEAAGKPMMIVFRCIP